MRASTSRFSAALLAAASLVASSPAWAQSGTRQPSRPAQPSQERSYPLALRGYCPVCLVNMKRWVPGSPEHEVIYDGHVYRFPGEEQKRMFEADPAKYTPALHGDCIVCYADMGRRVPGELNFGQFHRGRLFFFPSDRERQKFRSDPATYADADLAFGGNCAVCRIEMRQEVPGKPEYAVHYRGLRYLFPGPEQRAMFLADPEKYADRPPEGSGPAGDRRSSTGGPSESRVVSVRGRTSCAGCEFGVKPLEDPDVLGLAVVAGDEIYVVEGAHERYPELYEDRFAGRRVQLRGVALKQDRNVTWVRPSEVRIMP
ncbi:hypothetical protein [Tautonia sociabilis]|uniref:YHS domain-containing protein n=1 Tax=Tautonia sociabilis TaxID=2080755 RepID=A0A432MKK9_9BACT|nr:hypothetical protein [Tautonia sociabilis]RUL87952.1 hypothetical protein TsocGM_09500 [Tautonia sociabilis]